VAACLCTVRATTSWRHLWAARTGLSRRIRVVRPERRIGRGYGWVRDGCGAGQLHLRDISSCDARHATDLRAPQVGGAFGFILSYRG